MLTLNSSGQGLTSPVTSLAVDRGGGYIYGADPGQQEAVSWSVNSNGTLNPLPFSAPRNGPFTAIAAPIGAGIFAITTDGYIWSLWPGSLVGLYSCPVGNSPSAVAAEAGGRFVYVANGGDNTLLGFATNTCLPVN